MRNACYKKRWIHFLIFKNQEDVRVLKEQLQKYKNHYLIFYEENRDVSVKIFLENALTTLVDQPYRLDLNLRLINAAFQKKWLLNFLNPTFYMKSSFEDLLQISKAQRISSNKKNQSSMTFLKRSQKITLS